MSLKATAATYTAARDYVGDDSFTCKFKNCGGESNVATCSITLKPKRPFPKEQTVYTAVDKAVDIPASFSGGGGFVCTIKPGSPLHGTLTLDGTTFHYVPASHFSGADWFTWTMSSSSANDANDAQISTSATCWLVIKPPDVNDWPQWRADENRSGFTAMSLPSTLSLQWRRDQTPTLSPFGTPEVAKDHFNNPGDTFVTYRLLPSGTDGQADLCAGNRER